MYPDKLTQNQWLDQQWDYSSEDDPKVDALFEEDHSVALTLSQDKNGEVYTAIEKKLPDDSEEDPIDTRVYYLGLLRKSNIRKGDVLEGYYVVRTK